MAPYNHCDISLPARLRVPETSTSGRLPLEKNFIHDSNYRRTRRQPAESGCLSVRFDKHSPTN